MDKSLSASAHIIKDCNTRCTLVYPSTKSTVPTLNLKHGSCVRSLGENKQLLIETELIVSASRTQKGLPILWRRYDRFTSTVV
ncbi:MAG: hypothetical protein ACI4GC_03820 [Acutalibacteraceae bacterium]